ncbi:enoyl-CoA hydratase-related protein [Pseudooceanicola sp.]|uniref:enoyl-CoA hydratase/isomerase family protein n=1 Tax=Pseudooceanicola sp. TaxID=1914328 RepID=UPI00262F2DBA|nr:enoyl-CoA hydratase-related protein [Pseudooceanicola sp.]MDF1855899.1 enoyl-CoA hydratase-related protein [Pseudooceanicola sp.]
MGEARVMESGVEIREDGPVTIVTINRPKKMNAISSGAAKDIQQAFAEFDASDQRVAIITGAGGKAFSSGADVTDRPEFWRCVPTVGLDTAKPVIAAVDGWCIGGGMLLAVMADLCVCTETSKFSYPEAKVGITGGMIPALAARIPQKMAMEIILLGRTVAGRRAYEMGLVNEVTPAGGHLDAALQMAREMADMAPLVLSTLKTAVNRDVLARAPAEHMVHARIALDRVAQSYDSKEGVAAFREKRKPEFKGC